MNPRWRERALLVFAIVWLGVSCCRPRSHRRSASVSTPPVSAGAASGSSASTAAPPSSGLPLIDIPPGDDRPGSKTFTPAESFEARPSWSNATGYAPTISEFHAKNIFPKSPPQEGLSLADSPAFLLCRVECSAHPDSWFYTAPDLDIEFRIGTSKPIVAHGPEDTFVAFLSAPLVTASKKNLMSLEILDRDVGSREKLEKLTFPQKVPLPFLYKKGATAVQCRAWMPEDAERLFKAWVEIADRELEHISQKFISDGVLDGHRVDWGYEDWLSGAKGFVSNLAAVLGWADPRVQRRVQWISLLQDRFAALAAPAIGRQFSEGATSKGEWIDSFDDRVSVQALDASCGMRARKRFPSLFRRYADWAPHSPCVYRVKITPLRSDLSLDLKFHRISLTVEVGAAFADGHFERPVFADLEETLSEDPSANSRNIRAYQSRTALFIGTREVDVSNPMQEPKAFAVQRALGANPEPAMMRIPEIYR